MRYNEIIESVDDDDDLFGRAQHQRIADALMAAAEEDQRVADEERGNGDLENAAEFAEQARNYRYIANAFGESMAQGVKVYRSLDAGWRQAVEDVVDMDMEDQDMNWRSYAKTLPESQEDDDLFSTSAKLDRRHELKVKTIRRTAKRDELNIQPGTRILVKWDNGRYYKGVVDRLTRGGRLVVQVTFPNVGWPLEKNISPHQVRPEHILSETNDDDMFGEPDGAVQVYRLMHRLRDAVRRNPQGLKQALAQYPDAQRNLREKIAFDFMADELGMPRAALDELVTDMHMMPFRYSEPDWFSDYWNTRKLNAMIKRLGEMLKSWQLNEDNDNDLFGELDSSRRALQLLRRLRMAVERDPHGVSRMLKQYNNQNSTQEGRIEHTWNYMAQAVGMSRDVFDNYAEDFNILPWPTGVDVRRAWQIWDAQVLDKIINTMQGIVNNRYIPVLDRLNEDDDEDLFGPTVQEEVIHRVQEYKKGLETHLAVVRQADPEDAEYLEDVINDVNQVLIKLQKNWIEGMDALLQASDSEDWAGNIMHELKADNIPLSRYYRAPWLRERVNTR
jgi:hypothetical protein